MLHAKKTAVQSNICYGNLQSEAMVTVKKHFNKFFNIHNVWIQSACMHDSYGV